MFKRFDFLGVSISDINLKQVVKELTEHDYASSKYICFPDASVVKEANDDDKLKKILNNSFLTMPDGKPSQLAGRLQGYKNVSTVSGFHLCTALLQTDLTHYFYGGDEKVLEKLRAKMRTDFPAAKILGYKAPPFIAKNDIEKSTVISADFEEIKKLDPQLIWIGISSPKQDYLMYHFYKKLNRSVMLGVGGVFLYMADETLKSPEWIKKAGLRWLYRLAKEPSRLWPKYYGAIKFLLKNSGFFIKAWASKDLAKD